uniref:Uncharacterized protein n=1 Tax=Rhizophora mucronata TaxID=61149 RepID=A0A2P2N3T0_RHIMU
MTMMIKMTTGNQIPVSLLLYSFLISGKLPHEDLRLMRDR